MLLTTEQPLSILLAKSVYYFLLPTPTASPNTSPISFQTPRLIFLLYNLFSAISPAYTVMCMVSAPEQQAIYQGLTLRKSDSLSKLSSVAFSSLWQGKQKVFPFYAGIFNSLESHEGYLQVTIAAVGSCL